MSILQTETPLLLTTHAYQVQMKIGLVKQMVGMKLHELRTPSLVIDRTVLEKNSEALSRIPNELKTNVRVHVKTHKTIEGAQIQLEKSNTKAIVVSTLPEAYYMANSNLTMTGLLEDILLGFPITPDKFADIYELRTRVKTFQIFIDNLDTLEALEEYHQSTHQEHLIKVFLKVDCGYGRAGVPLNNPDTLELAKRLAFSKSVQFVGIYTHAGHSYSSTNAQEALTYLKNECDSARAFRDYFVENNVPIPYISIGATPTVKAIITHMDKVDMKEILKDIDEVHAGAYAFLDRQQVATGMGTFSDVAVSVACRIASNYKDRGTMLIDGGALAFSKDTAPQGGFGYVVGKDDKVVASLNKISQEHGILQQTDSDDKKSPELKIGDVVRVIPNHVCLTTACHLYYLIVEDGGDIVVDVWIPVKGW